MVFLFLCMFLDYDLVLSFRNGSPFSRIDLVILQVREWIQNGYGFSLLQKFERLFGVVLILGLQFLLLLFSSLVGCLRLQSHLKFKRSVESMSDCVPDWDASTGQLDATIPLSFLSNSKLGLQQLPKINTLDVANVPDHEFCLRASNPDGGGSISIPAQYGKIAKHASGHLNFLSNFDQQIESTSWTRTTDSSDFSRDGSLDSLVNSVVAGDLACSLGTEDTLDFSVSSIDEDMLAYLYPLDNPLDRSYSIDTLREPPNSQLNFHKGSSEIECSGGQLNLLPQNSNSVLLNKAGDVVMGSAARHSAGFQHSGEVPEKAGSILPEPLTSKGPQTLQSNPMDTISASISSGYQSTVAAPSPMLPPRWQPIHSSATFSSSTSDTGSVNFAYFSRPAALAKANLQTLGVWGTKAADHMQQHSGVSKENVRDGASLAESTCKSHILSCPGKDVCFQGASPQQASSGQPNAASCELSLPSTRETVRIEEEITKQNGNGTDTKGKSSELEKQQCSSITGSAAHGDKGSQSAAEVLEAFEPTITTSQACSGNTAECTKKELLTKGKKKPRELDDPTECQSQNAEDDSVELKKPVRGSSSSKRTRAAEVHNLSERRRRDRINEKMKALQELIPNSNKTDKASMLDEAIEYLKMLQLQLQMMSLRSGLSIPPVVVSPGMQHQQMPQMAQLACIGMGRGGGLGMGMGMMDMGSGDSGRPLMFLPSIHGPSHLPTRPPTMSNIHERVSGPAVVDFYNRLVTGQQLQVPSQPINMNLYHPYMLQQQQQQQIHSQQVYEYLQPSSTTACGPP